MISEIKEPRTENEMLIYKKACKILHVLLEEINGANFLDGLQIMGSINVTFLKATWDMLPPEAKIASEEMIRDTYKNVLDFALVMEKA